MDNQDIQENQVIVVNESEEDPRLASLEGHKSEERSFSAKERQESPSNLISKLPSKSKIKRIKREPSTDGGFSREVSPELHYTQRRQSNVVRREVEVIL